VAEAFLLFEEKKEGARDKTPPNTCFSGKPHLLKFPEPPGDQGFKIRVYGAHFLFKQVSLPLSLLPGPCIARQMLQP
jgi:hypothetical protein